MNHYNIGLDQCKANYQALTPIRFLQRSADVFPDRTAVIYKDKKYAIHNF
jgi:fatty-acyl-CoA synthase